MSRRPVLLSRSCGTWCGGTEQRTTDADENVACGGWHRNKRRWCQADAKWAITYIDGPPMDTDAANGPQPFFRCTYCARPYRDGYAGNFRVERLMDEPPRALVA